MKNKKISDADALRNTMCSILAMHRMNSGGKIEEMKPMADTFLEWVDCKSGYPKTPQWVLCYFPSEGFMDVMYYRGMEGFDEQGERIISHWQPLPAPPVKK